MLSFPSIASAAANIMSGEWLRRAADGCALMGVFSPDGCTFGCTPGNGRGYSPVIYWWT